LKRLKKPRTSQQGSDVVEKPALIFVLGSTVNKTAATWEQASTSPAMHVQWAQIVLPLCLIPHHTFDGDSERA